MEIIHKIHPKKFIVGMIMMVGQLVPLIALSFFQTYSLLISFISGMSAILGLCILRFESQEPESSWTILCYGYSVGCLALQVFILGANYFQ